MINVLVRNRNEVPSYAGEPGMDDMLTAKMAGVLRWAHMPVTERNIELAKRKARIAHTTRYGNSNLTDWRIDQMEVDQVAKLIASQCRRKVQF